MSFPLLHGELNSNIPNDEYPILPESVQEILRTIGMRAIDTLVTCTNCGCVTEIGRRCDNCGRIV